MIRLIIPTMLSKIEYQKTNAYKCLAKIEENNPWESFSVRIIEKNKKGLSELYNEYLLKNKPPDIHNKDDIVVFMHDDVEIHDLFFIEKLKKAHETYDIVGLAGATTQDYSRLNVPSVWHLSSRDKNDSRGFVSHFVPKGWNNVKESHYNSSYFGPTPAEVAVIDGLFMSVKMSSIIDNNVEFDKDFNWHHYDLSFCISAKKAGLKIGVFPIFVIHHGLGEFNNTEWTESDKLFRQKYGNVKLKL